MFKKSIEYVDFNGNPRKEDFYFHLSIPEVTRIEADLNGVTIKDHIEKIVKDGNMKELLSFLERIILESYGVKSADGRSFQKNDKIREEFENSQAYAEFFEMLLTEEGLANRFGENIAEKAKIRVDDNIRPFPPKHPDQNGSTPRG